MSPYRHVPQAFKAIVESRMRGYHVSLVWELGCVSTRDITVLYVRRIWRPEKLIFYETDRRFLK